MNLLGINRTRFARGIAGLGTFYFVLLYLVIGETIMEVRATWRGWDTVLFGEPAFHEAEPGQGGERYGPAPGFPFRSLVIPVAKKKFTKRFWIASSSYGVATSLPAHDIFPNRMPKILAERGIMGEVINASRIGAGIVENNGDLGELGGRWKPDYAILYEMSNDVTSLSKRFLSSSHAGRGAASQNDRPRSPIGVKPVSRFLENTTLYAYLQSGVRSRVAQNRILYDSIGLAAEREFETSVRDFLGLCRALHTRPVLCTFAVSHGSKNVENWPPDLRSFLFRWNIFLSIKGWASTLNRFNAIIRSLAEENHVVLVDIEKAMDGDSQYFIDFVHFTVRGHEKAANLIAEAVIKDISQRPRRTGL